MIYTEEIITEIVAVLDQEHSDKYTKATAIWDKLVELKAAKDFKERIPNSEAL
jgi:hypothetical protein